MHSKKYFESAIFCGVIVLFCNVGIVDVQAAPVADATKLSARNKREAFAKSCELNQRGVALEEQGKAKEAIELFKMAIAVYPSYSVHYCNLGNAYSDLHKYNEAIAQYKKAVSLAPDFATAYCNMADAMLKIKDFMGAELACMSAIRVDPGYVPAMTNLAEVYLDTNRPHDAITVLNKARGLTITAGMKKIIVADLERANKMLKTATQLGMIESTESPKE